MSKMKRMKGKLSSAVELQVMAMAKLAAVNLPQVLAMRVEVWMMLKKLLKKVI